MVVRGVRGGVHDGGRDGGEIREVMYQLFHDYDGDGRGDVHDVRGVRVRESFS